MTLYLVERDLKIKILLTIFQQDLEELLDPLFNRENIGNMPIMNVSIDKQENSNINHRARYIIKLM